MEDQVQSKGRLVRDEVLEIVQKMPSSNLTNYMFANEGDGTFSNQTSHFGLDQPANSNGAAYADLDNDGDLDLIVNNINTPAFIYRNDLNTDNNKFLKVRLEGEGGNTQGVGARVTLYHGSIRQSVEQIPTRGYLSTVTGILHFGLGDLPALDSMEVRWNRGGRQTLTNVNSNQVLVLHERDAAKKQPAPLTEAPLIHEIFSPINYTVARSGINDFKRQSLLIAQFSHNAPCMAKGDLNLDGLEDMFIGGIKGQAGAVFLQGPGGGFSRKEIADLSADKGHHDSDAVLFDANGDGFTDLYVGSGGYHDFNPDDPMLQDRIYLGDGTGALRRERGALPDFYGSTSTIAVADLNDDGSPDLFVGSRVVPGRYPEQPQNYLLINNGKGLFTDMANSMPPRLKGMVTDALWADLDLDGSNELVVAGEWMPVSVFGMRDGQLVDETPDFLDGEYRGWWNTIESSDYNKDGRPDLLIGNMGTNTQFVGTPQEPAELHYSDFDGNGSVDPIFSFYIQGKSYPYVTRDELLGQLAYLRSKFTTYERYANATLTDIFSTSEIENSERLWANHMETTLFLSKADGKYERAALPGQAQYSPVYAVSSGDFNSDGNQDILLFGNNEFFKLRLGRFDANYGTLLLGDGKGNFEYADSRRSGLSVKGDVRSLIRIRDLIFLGIYGDAIKALKVNTPNKSTNEEAVSK
jgi:hypothetical protein